MTVNSMNGTITEGVEVDGIPLAMGTFCVGGADDAKDHPTDGSRFAPRLISLPRIGQAPIPFSADFPRDL